MAVIPFRKARSRDIPGTWQAFDWWQNGNRSVPRVDYPLAYEMFTRSSERIIGNGIPQKSIVGARTISNYVLNYTSTTSPVRRAYVDAQNKALQRLQTMNNTQSQAALGITAFTVGESLSMIAKRASQLRVGWSRLRRGNFRGFLRTFGIRPKRKHESTIHTRSGEASGLWLEYSFGWTPLVQDIYDASQVLSEDFPPERLVATAKSQIDYHKPRTNIGAGRWSEERAKGAVSVRIQADAKVTNPNLYLAAKLGLINPLEVAWDVVPFSFVVDWFLPVGQMLRSYSAFAGVDLTRPCVTQKIFLSGEERFTLTSGALNELVNTSAFRMTRTTSLPSYIFQRKSLKLPSPSLALIQVSLLRQVFIK